MTAVNKKILLAAAFFAILAAAFFLRSTGLYDHFHTDEQAVMTPVEKMSKAFSFDPDFYKRPNHVSIYLNFAVQNTVSFLRFGKPLAYTYDANVPFYFAVARGINAVVGTAMVVLAYLIGLEFSKRIAFISGFLFAFFPVFVEHSQLITPDIPTACITLAMILASIRLIKNYSRRQFILLVFLCALNVVEKYPSLISFSLVLAVLGVRTIRVYREKPWQKYFVDAVKAGLLMVFFCYIVSPSLFIHPKKTLGAILNESGGHLGADGLGFFGNLLFYGESFFRTAGILSLIFFALGVYALIVRKEKAPILPILYGFLYWVLMSLLPLHWVRWGIPMYAAPLFVIAFGVDRLMAFRPGRIASYALLPVAAVNLLVVSVFLILPYNMENTVNVSEAFVSAHGMDPTNTIYEGYTTFYKYGPSKKLDWNEKKDDPAYTYVVLSSSMKLRYLAEPLRNPERVKAYREIEQLELIKTISPSPLPEVSYFEIKNILRLAPYAAAAVSSGFAEYYKGPTLWFYRK